MYRNRESVFELTARESFILSMRRAGLTLKQIAAKLGVHKIAGAYIDAASDKERLLTLARKDKSRAGGKTTLAQARGNDHRLIGKPNVRIGEWKNRS